MRERYSWMGGILIAALCMSSCRHQAASEESEGMLTLIAGSYAPASEEGVRMFHFDQETGESTPVCGLRGISNPSFLIIARDGRRVYAVGENKEDSATVNLVVLDRETGTLTLADTKAVHGADPCHLAITPDSTHLLTANYSGGSITSFPLNANGTIGDGHVQRFTGSGPDSTRQEQAHIHCIYFSPDSKWLMADDLGSDCIRMFPLDPHSRCGYVEDMMREARVAPGSGPRHAVFDTAGRHLYLLDELKGDVVTWDYAHGELRQTQSIQADSVGARGSADIHLSPDGRFLYASNRLKADGIAIFRVDSASGQLTHIGYQNTGAHPRNFAITPNGKFVLVACRDADRIEVYSRNAETGMLTDTGKSIPMPKPVVVQMVK